LRDFQAVPLTKGFVAVVDESDIAEVTRYKWYARICSGRPYAYNNKIGYLHRFILKDVVMVDHKNGDTLDNRRGNLRAATRSQNGANSGKHAGKWSSEYKGVTWDKRKHKWIAKIGQRTIGRFESEEDAAEAYNKAAIQKYGEYARTN
jgi:hypothetical protein